MAKRITSALAAVVLLIAVLYVNNGLKIGIAIYAIALLALVAIYEIYKAIDVKKHKSLCIIGALTSLAVIFMVNSAANIISMSIIVFFAAAVFNHDNINFDKMCTAAFSTFYITLGFHYLERLLNLEFGIGMLFFALIAAFITDSGAYFTGRAFGKHKLAEALSPKKTVEGSIGGCISAVIGILVYKYVMQSVYSGIEVNTINIIINVLIASVAGQIGDLSASLVKREHKIKDYGNIMPGHGGVMDRFDSVLFVAPVVYFLNRLLPIISKI